jgi:spore maturation protein A
MNTASMQIIPATVGYLRQSYGSDSPFSIIPAVLVSSAVALLVALLLSKFMNKVSKWK